MDEEPEEEAGLIEEMLYFKMFSTLLVETDLACLVFMWMPSYLQERSSLYLVTIAVQAVLAYHDAVLHGRVLQHLGKCGICKSSKFGLSPSRILFISVKSSGVFHH